MGTVVRVDGRARPFDDTLNAAAAGEYWALESLAVQCLPKLTSFAEARGAVDPDGIANTVMMEFFQKLDGLVFEAPAQMWAYLYRIARSRIIDERRAIKPVEYRDAPAMEGLVPPSDDFDEEVADRHYVSGLLSELTSEQREVLEMRFLDDLSIEETASRTGRTLTAVKGLQRRAIKALSTAAVILAVLLVGGAVWAILDREPRVATTASDSPPTLEVELGTTVGGNGPVDTGAIVGPGDYVPPSTVITEMSAVEDDPRAVSFEFEADDELTGVAGFECRLDGGEYSPCTSPQTYDDLADGSHVFEVRSFDLAHNRERTPASRVWTVEVVVPEGTPRGVDVGALRVADTVYKCAGVKGTWAQIEAEGYDVMVGTEGDDLIDVSGGDKPDFVMGFDGNDSILTGDGDDVVCSGSGNDTIETGDGKDRVVGHNGNDTITTGSGDDRVWGGSGNDSIHAGSGDDTVKGDGGIDTIDGHKGNDRILGNAGFDVLIGGEGEDACEHGDDGGQNDPSCEKTSPPEPAPAPAAAPDPAPAPTAAPTAGN